MTRSTRRLVSRASAWRAGSSGGRPPRWTRWTTRARTAPEPARGFVITCAAMILTIGCAGFPVPATRYFKEFLFVEVQETHVALPGTGTIRRWRREAPKGFKFALLAPREIGQEGFRDGKVTETALKSLTEVGKELLATTAVFMAPPEFTASRGNRAALKDFLQGVRKKFERVVWEPPIAYGTSSVPVAYYRLPGPAGHKSRYEDPAIEKLAELARVAKNKDATYVF